MSESFSALKTAVVIEDDPDVRHLLSEVLESAGFSVISVGNGIDGVRAVFTYQPLITTLDVNMPGIDGFEAARRIRAGSDTYIIMLTALDEEADVVLGLSAGADEYLNKPFRPRELRARIEALLRRPRGQQNGAPRQDQAGPSFPSTRSIPIISREPAPSVQPPEGEAAAALPPHMAVASAATAETPNQTPVAVLIPSAQSSQDDTVAVRDEDAGEGWLEHRDLLLHPEYRMVRIQHTEVELTRTEFDLLAALMESKRRVRSKADLTLLLRGESYVTSYFVGDADKRAIEAHMTNLRRKLGDNPMQPRYIETVRGVGYRLTSALND